MPGPKRRSVGRTPIMKAPWGNSSSKTSVAGLRRRMARRWRRLLAAKGLEAAEVRAGADLVVLNTCTVTSSADDDVRQTIRRVHRENPAARILVTGCYAQRAPEELASLAGVEWVVGNSHKTQIAELVTVGALPRQYPRRAISSRSMIFCPPQWRTRPATGRVPTSRSRMDATTGARSASFRLCAGAAVARPPGGW